MRSVLHESILGVTERPAPVTPPRVATPIDDLLAKEQRLLDHLDLVRDAISRQLVELRKARGYNEEGAALLSGVRTRVIHALERYSLAKHMWKRDDVDRLAQCYARIAVDRTPVARKFNGRPNCAGRLGATG